VGEFRIHLGLMLSAPKSDLQRRFITESKMNQGESFQMIFNLLPNPSARWALQRQAGYETLTLKDLCKSQLRELL